ncbi:MAG: radical SAM family heme chaperone HemW [Gemmatimonadetes bacterium]|nr:radical SAM family heme chaperone HemW [Gemmatimonadota bacterium]
MHLYVHVPFCARRCSYCDFAIAVRRRDPSAAFRDAVRAELGQLFAATVPFEGRIETVYYGGGTPSRLDPGVLAEIHRDLADRFDLAPDAEVTLEANPEDVDHTRAAAWRSAGINRVSLGVQSFSREVLRWMHRSDDPEQVDRAVSSLRGAGIANISFDLIYGLPSQLARHWTSELDRAFALGIDHLSLYALTVESGTPLGRWTERGTVVPAADTVAESEYLAACAAIRQRGWHHYEVSNAARPGFESRHNLGYWRRRPYLGLGPSAHSAAGDRRWWNIREWEAYRRAAGRGDLLVAGEERLTATQVRLEEAYLGLRCVDGVAASSLPEAIVSQWLAAGWAGLVGSQVVLTARGWLRLDGLVRQAGVA